MRERKIEAVSGLLLLQLLLFTYEDGSDCCVHLATEALSMQLMLGWFLPK